MKQTEEEIMLEKKKELEEFYKTRKIYEKTPRKFDDIKGKVGKGHSNDPVFYTLNDNFDDK